MADYAKDVLVETDWVAEHLDDDGIRIVEVDENPALYAEAHIPGAIGFDWKQDLQDQVKRDFLSAEDFGNLMGSRGISNDHTVVLYGDRNNWFAAYTYWYFLYYGHDKVKLINGPREKWIAEDKPTSTDVPSYPQATFEAKAGDDSIRALRDEVLAALDAETKLVGGLEGAVLLHRLRPRHGRGARDVAGALRTLLLVARHRDQLAGVLLR